MTMIDLTHVELFVAGADHVYWSVSNVGDLLITLAAASQQSNARLVHTGRQSLTENVSGWYDFLMSWPAFFNVPCLYVGDERGETLHAMEQFMHTCPQYHPMIAPPIRAYRGRWFRDPAWGRDWETIHARLVRPTHWSSRFQTPVSLPLSRPLCVMAPSGSTRRWKRQRFLTVDEAQSLVTRLHTQGYTVVLTGNADEQRVYPIPDTYWLTHTTLTTPDQQTHTIPFAEFVNILAAGTLYISMDTWLKTFVSLLDRPVYVIRTRAHGVYVPFGEQAADHIFTDVRAWPRMSLVTLDELHASLLSK